MKVHVKCEGEYIKGLEVEYSVGEMQIINQALRQFARDPENAFVDSIKALDMADDVLASVRTKSEKNEWLVYYDEDCPQDGIFKCPLCGQVISVDTPIPLNFCPNCGADMRDKDDE